MTHGLRDAVTEHVGELSTRVHSEVAPLLGRAAETARPALDRAIVTTAPLLDRAAESAAPLVDAASGAVSDAFDTSMRRGGAALLALRGERVLPPAAARRWPWAVGAALLGAAAGAAVALLVGRVLGTDAPDAQEPEELEAVVDRPVTP